MGAWTVNQPLVLAQVAFSKNKLKEISHFDPAFLADKIKFSESWYEHTSFSAGCSPQMSPDRGLCGSRIKAAGHKCNYKILVYLHSNAPKEFV